MTYDPSEARDERGRWAGGTDDPGTMTGGAINKELDRLDAVHSQITKEMIDTGRGYEKPSETFTKSDPLSLHYKAASDRRYALHQEIRARYGPGGEGGPPRRLPYGVGRGRRIKKL